MQGFPGGTSDKQWSANAGDLRDMGSIPGAERSPGGGNGSPFQYSCLENPMDMEASSVLTDRPVDELLMCIYIHTEYYSVITFFFYHFNNIDGTEYYA